jgi:hypothetical protein
MWWTVAKEAATSWSGHKDASSQITPCSPWVRSS